MTKNLFLNPVMSFVPLGTAGRKAEELIIYGCSDDSGNNQIWVYNLNKGENVKITEDKTHKTHPDYCADENLLFYRSFSEIYSFNLDTKETKQVYKDRYFITDLRCYQGKILFARFNSEAGDDSDILLLDVNTNNLQTLTSQVRLHYDPHISKDGKKLVYTAGAGLHTQDNHIYLKDMHSAKIKRLTFTNGYQTQPMFSPDNRQIAFVVCDDFCNRHIWRMDADGKNKKQLTKQETLDSNPCWSPDGSKISYVSFHHDKHYMMIMDSNGKNKNVLFTSEHSCHEPKWVKKLGTTPIFSNGKYGGCP